MPVLLSMIWGDVTERHPHGTPGGAGAPLQSVSGARPARRPLAAGARSACTVDPDIGGCAETSASHGGTGWRLL